MKKLGITINGVLRDLEFQFDKVYRKAFIRNDSLVGMNENFEAVEEETDWEKEERLEKEKITLPVDTTDFMNHYKFDSKISFENFINEDYNFQILGAATALPKSFDYLLRIQNVGEANQLFDTTIFSKENGKSITSTLNFLGKSMCRTKSLKFLDDYKNIWDFCDVIITDLPEILESKPEGKTSIKINKLYNQWSPSDYTFDSLAEVSDKEFLANLFSLALQ